MLALLRGLHVHETVSSPQIASLVQMCLATRQQTDKCTHTAPTEITAQDQSAVSPLIKSLRPGHDNHDACSGFRSLHSSTAACAAHDMDAFMRLKLKHAKRSGRSDDDGDGPSTSYGSTLGSGFRQNVIFETIQSGPYPKQGRHHSNGNHTRSRSSSSRHGLYWEGDGHDYVDDDPAFKSGRRSQDGWQQARRGQQKSQTQSSPHRHSRHHADSCHSSQHHSTHDTKHRMGHSSSYRRSTSSYARSIHSSSGSTSKRKAISKYWKFAQGGSHGHWWKKYYDAGPIDSDDEYATDIEDDAYSHFAFRGSGHGHASWSSWAGSSFKDSEWAGHRPRPTTSEDREWYDASWGQKPGSASGPGNTSWQRYNAGNTNWWEQYSYSQQQQQQQQSQQSRAHSSTYGSTHGAGWRTPYSTHPPQVVAHLSTLGLSPATQLQSASLKAAFHKCAMQWHPDRWSSVAGEGCTGPEGVSAAEAAERFKAAQAAYEALRCLC